MSHAILYAQTAKKTRSKTARDESLAQGQGLDKGAKEKVEALFQELFNKTQGWISRVYIPGTMVKVVELYRGGETDQERLF